MKSNEAKPEIISVIVPVYNLESVIGRCIESIQNQTYPHLQILLIDDGSRDNSLEIMESYADKDPRIQVFTQPNSGVSTARNKGLEEAIGEWIGFVDGDDALEPAFYQTLLDGVHSSGALMACTGVNVIDTKGNPLPHLPTTDLPKKPTLLSDERMLDALLSPSSRILFWGPWDKLYAASIAKNTRYETNIRMAEDLFYVLNCLLKAKSIYYIPTPLYHYINRPDSAVGTKKFTRYSFNPAEIAQKIVDLVALYHMPESVMNLARTHQAVVTARVVRFFNQALNRKEIRSKAWLTEIDRLRKQLRVYLKSPASKGLDLKRGLLVYEAAYFPWMFHIR